MRRVAICFLDEGGCDGELAFAEQVHGDSAVDERGVG